MTPAVRRHRILSTLLGFLLISLVTLVWSDGLLRNLGEDGHTLEAFTGKGKWVVVKFWVSDCHICNEEAYQYVDFHEFHKDRDAVMLGVSLDGREREAAQAFIHRHQVSYVNLITGLTHDTQLYSRLSGQNWIGTPSFLIFDPSGILRARQAGAVTAELIERFIEKTEHAARKAAIN